MMQLFYLLFCPPANHYNYMITEFLPLCLCLFHFLSLSLCLCLSVCLSLSLSLSLTHPKALSTRALQELPEKLSTETATG